MQPEAFFRLFSLSAAPQEQTHAPYFMAIISQNVDVFNEAAKYEDILTINSCGEEEPPLVMWHQSSQATHQIHSHAHVLDKKRKKKKQAKCSFKKIKINRASFSSELLESPPAALQLNFSPLRLAQSHRFRFALWRRKMNRPARSQKSLKKNNNSDRKSRDSPLYG